MTNLLNTMDVYVLPVFNVDGYVYSHTTVGYNLFDLKFILTKPNGIIEMYFYPIVNNRTGCGERLALGYPEHLAGEQIPTGTLMLAGAVSAKTELYLRRKIENH